MRRRQFLQSGTILLGATAVLKSQERGWSLRFARVVDYAEVRAGGPRGPLIQWNGKGCGRFTWCRNDGPGPRFGLPIGSWVGDAAVIGLYGRVTGSKGYGDCLVQVLRNGSVVGNWQFSREEFREFR